MLSSIKLVGMARFTRWVAWASMLSYSANQVWLVIGLWPNALAWTGIPGMSLALDLDNFQDQHHWAMLLADGPAWAGSLEYLYQRGVPAAVPRHLRGLFDRRGQVCYHLMQREAKQFFFEKKNQKTFATSGKSNPTRVL